MRKAAEGDHGYETWFDVSELEWNGHRRWSGGEGSRAVGVGVLVDMEMFTIAFCSVH